MGSGATGGGRQPPGGPASPSGAPCTVAVAVARPASEAVRVYHRVVTLPPGRPGLTCNSDLTLVECGVALAPVGAPPPCRRRAPKLKYEVAITSGFLSEGRAGTARERSERVPRVCLQNCFGRLPPSTV